MARICGEFDDRLADLLGGKGRTGLFQESGDVLALASRVRGDRGRAKVGGGCQLRKDRDEPDAETVRSDSSAA